MPWGGEVGSKALDVTASIATYNQFRSFNLVMGFRGSVSNHLSRHIVSDHGFVVGCVL